ncbi:hypothetical protein FRX31_012370 [Thalictrum thalictroides]|uniref:Uncharacterized protein n=1 Tax=Thalictrum thalictroides TaxID=46969 RepID=A0A7J6WPI5_THATH|nr:hypothetical protein FRX31_012370 [Thalictrum thalictroides]
MAFACLVPLFPTPSALRAATRGVRAGVAYGGVTVRVERPHGEQALPHGVVVGEVQSLLGKQLLHVHWQLATEQGDLRFVARNQVRGGESVELGEEGGKVGGVPRKAFELPPTAGSKPVVGDPEVLSDKTDVLLESAASKESVVVGVLGSHPVEGWSDEVTGQPSALLGVRVHLGLQEPGERGLHDQTVQVLPIATVE